MTGVSQHGERYSVEANVEFVQICIGSLAVPVNITSCSSLSLTEQAVDKPRTENNANRFILMLQGKILNMREEGDECRGEGTWVEGVGGEGGGGFVELLK